MTVPTRSRNAFQERLVERLGRPLERMGLWLIAGAMVSFYFWTATSGPAGFRLDLAPGMDYYNLLLDGFRKGQLALDYEGDPGIHALADPYDPVQNEKYRLLDISYYQGKYYIYFGPTPVLTLLWPFHALTGRHLPTHLAAATFTSASFLVGLAWLVGMRRRYFPTASSVMVFGAVIAWGLCTMFPVLLRRASVYELAIACGVFFVLVTLWLLTEVVHHRSPARRLVLLGLAGTAFGLALGARPTFLFAGVTLLGAAGILWLDRSRAAPGAGAIWIRQLLAMALPLGVIVAGLLWYNWARFDNPFEFGQIYQLTSRDMGKVEAFRWRYVPFNAYLYLLMPPQWSAYFPFVLPGLPPPMPQGYDGLDNLYGILPCLPLVGVLLGLPWVWRKTEREARWIIVLLLLAFGGTFGVFVGFSGATIRYYADFMPPLILLACLAGLALSAHRDTGKRFSGMLRVSWAALAAYSMGFAVFVSFQHAGLLRAHHPRLWDRLAYVPNYVSHLLGLALGVKYGPLQLEVTFPEGVRGTFQPLLVSGKPPALDYLWLLFRENGDLQIGYEKVSVGGLSSQVVHRQPGARHLVQVDAGFLYPPAGHPWFRGRSEAEIVEIRSRLQVSVDGIPYVESRRETYDPTGWTPSIGVDPHGSAFGKQFTGTIHRIERASGPTGSSMPSAQYGAVELALRFPQEATGKHEPLVVTGVEGKGDILYVTYLGENEIRLTLDHWGIGALASPPIELNLGLVHILQIEMGSLYGPENPERAQTLRVRLNGRIVWDTQARFHAAGPETFTFGSNLIGGSTAGSLFTGTIYTLKRFP